MPLQIERSSEKDVIIGFDEDTDCNEDTINESEMSISSEEEFGSGSDCDERVRTRSIQDIWDCQDVWHSLLALENADPVLETIHNREFQNLLIQDATKKTALLISCWLGNSSALKYLLNHNVVIQIADSAGRSPLHLATCSGNYECVKLLLDTGAPVNVWDTAHTATPIHCAASRGYLTCIKILVKYGAEVNAGITNKSPLHYAVQSLAASCVKELLEAGAIPNTPQVYTETPLHVAAALGSPDIIELLIKHGAAVAVQCGPEKITPLHLAAEDGNVKSASLLLDAGAHLGALNKKLQTPLHLATLSQSAEMLQLLISRGADPNLPDNDGRTPLHGAIVKASRCECVSILLNSGANVNKPDAFGYTPLHLAALNEYSHFVMMLINHGGDVTARTNGGISVLTFITRRTPDVIPKYIEKFDSSIKLNDHELGDVDCELKLDFRVLVPTSGKGETELLLNFIEVGHRDVLKHPLCETFLFLKWKRIRKFFLFSLFYHSLFVLLFTGYVIGVFLRNCPHTRSFSDNCIVPIYVRVTGYFLILLNLLVMAKEIFQIAHNWSAYIRQWENWLQWLIIGSIYLSVFPVNHMDIRYNVQTWQHHVAAIGIFFAWLELLMIVGRFPVFGLYVQMFTTVSLNFTKFLIAYACLIIAFCLSFGVLFAHYPSFENLTWGILKTIIMMSGELEFEDMFYDSDHQILYPITTHFMFLAFVLLVTLILNNLMVGLAVNDIQGLLQSAGLDRLVRQAELVAHLESMLFSRLLRWAPKRFLKFFYKHALLLKSRYHWALYVRPNDPREERIPKELIKSIYEFVANQKDILRTKNKSIYKFKRNSQKLAEMSKHPHIRQLHSNNSIKQNQILLKGQIELLHKEVQEMKKTLYDQFNVLKGIVETEQR